MVVPRIDAVFAVAVKVLMMSTSIMAARRSAAETDGASAASGLAGVMVLMTATAFTNVDLPAVPRDGGVGRGTSSSRRPNCSACEAAAGAGPAYSGTSTCIPQKTLAAVEPVAMDDIMLGEILLAAARRRNNRAEYSDQDVGRMWAGMSRICRIAHAVNNQRMSHQETSVTGHGVTPHNIENGRAVGRITGTATSCNMSGLSDAAGFDRDDLVTWGAIACRDRRPADGGKANAGGQQGTDMLGQTSAAVATGG